MWEKGFQGKTSTYDSTHALWDTLCGMVMKPTCYSLNNARIQVMSHAELLEFIFGASNPKFNFDPLICGPSTGTCPLYN